MKCRVEAISDFGHRGLSSGKCVWCKKEYVEGEEIQECTYDPHAPIIKEGRPNYGPYPEVARISQQIFDAYSSGPSYKKLSNSQKETLRMNAVKTARIVCGDPLYPDNWVDIVGYTNLIVNQLKEKSNDSTS